MPDTTSHLIPLVVAVAGHPDIEPAHEDAIRKHIVQRLAALAAKYKHTPFRCLTGLSEGSGMVFAEAALALKSQMPSSFKLELVAVLTDEPDELEKVFHRPEHPKRETAGLVDRFRGLLDKCSERIILTRGPLADPLDGDKLAGEYMARHSHLLLAVWDGKSDDAHSSVNHVVDYFKDNAPDLRSPPKFRVLDAPEPRPVHHLLVQRGEAANANEFQWQNFQEEGILATLKRHMDKLRDLWLASRSHDASKQGRAATHTAPDKKKAEKEYSDRMLKALDGFNAAVAERAAADPAILTWDGYIRLKAEDLTRTEQRLWRIYSAADFLALYYQKKAHWALISIIIAAVLMVFFFALYAHYKTIFLLVLYIMAFVSGFGVFYWSNRANVYVRYLDYRGLAEGLRVQLFYCLSGLDTHVAGYYMRKHKSELAWIRSAIRTLYYGEDRKNPRKELVVEHWINDQHKYFFKKYPEDEKRYKHITHIAHVVFVFGILIAATVCIHEIFSSREAIKDLHKAIIIILMEMLPATAAALTGYAYRKCLDQQVKQYAHMSELFGRARSAVASQSIGTETDFQTLVEELGKEALAENGDWVLLHRDRPIPWAAT